MTRITNLKCITSFTLPLLLFTGVAFASGQPSPTVQITKEVQIGNTKAAYYDPEISNGNNQITFMDQSLNVWLGQLDPATGNLVNNGYGVKIGKSSQVTNGPEFGESSQGQSIYFNGNDDKGITQLFRYRNGKTEQITQGPSKYGGNLASKDIGDPNPRIGVGKDGVGGFIYENKPTEFHPVPVAKIGVKVPRWIPGELAIGTNAKDKNGLVQIARFDITNNQLSLLSSDGDNKQDAFFFKMPEKNGQMAFFATTDKGQIAVYETVNGAWTRVRTLNAPYGKYTFVEPFFYKNRTFLSTMVVDPKKPSQSVIYVVSLDGKIVLPVSEKTNLFRFDPEAYVVGEKFYLYYYTMKPLLPNKFFRTTVSIPDSMLK